MLCRAAMQGIAATALVGAVAYPVKASETGVLEQSIIGGDSSDPGEYPATGAFLLGGRYRCTATLIAPDVVLTAAHCLEDIGFGAFGFTLAANLGAGDIDEVPVALAHQHPDYHANGEEYTRLSKRNDLGIAILEEPIEGVEIEELDARTASEAGLTSGSELTLCGYGQSEWASRNSAGIKRDAIVFVDRSTAWELQTIDENPQPCNGDSGGPLFALEGGHRQIAGVVSRAAFGSSMCDTGALYTRIGPYIDWIEEASQDRNAGSCAVGSTRASASTWMVLVACLLLARRRRGVRRAESAGRSRSAI